MPGLPLFCRTRFNAPTRLARPTTSSIRRCSLPERSSPWATVPASPLPSTFGASPLSSSGSSSCLDSWRMAFSRSTVVTLSSPFGPSSDKAGSKRIMHFVGLLWPLLTSRSAGRPNSAMPASPFQASGETSPGKNDDLPRTIAGSTPLPLGRRSFAVSGPLAPVRSASYPVPVRRLTGSFHASFSVRLTTNALRFPSVLRPGSGRTFTSKSSATCWVICRSPPASSSEGDVPGGDEAGREAGRAEARAARPTLERDHPSAVGQPTRRRSCEMFGSTG